MNKIKKLFYTGNVAQIKIHQQMLSRTHCASAIDWEWSHSQMHLYPQKQQPKYTNSVDVNANAI